MVFSYPGALNTWTVDYEISWESIASVFLPNLEGSDNVAATGKRILSVPFAGDDRMISVPHAAVRPLKPPDKQLVPNLRSKVFSR